VIMGRVRRVFRRVSRQATQLKVLRVAVPEACPARRLSAPPPEAPSPAVETELTAADRFHSALGQQALLLASRTQPARRRWRNDIHRTSPGRSVRASWMAGPSAFDP